jgi:hypothetical protein
MSRTLTTAASVGTISTRAAGMSINSMTVANIVTGVAPNSTSFLSFSLWIFFLALCFAV